MVDRAVTKSATAVNAAGAGDDSLQVDGRGRENKVLKTRLSDNPVCFRITLDGYAIVWNAIRYRAYDPSNCELRSHSLQCLLFTST